MKLNDYIEAFHARWQMILALGVVGLAVGLLFSVVVTPQFRASTSVYLQPQVNDDPSALSQMAVYMEYQATTYADMANKSSLQGEVVDELGLDLEASEMSDKVSADVPEGTFAINIAAESENRQQSIAIANATATVLRGYVNQSEPRLNGGPTLELIVTDPATDATKEMPGSGFFTVLGLLLGVLIGAIVALILPARTSEARSSVRPVDRSDEESALAHGW